MQWLEIRHALTLTQSALAENLGVGQAEISKIEIRTDMFVSTLRKFIEAMGGEPEIRANFPDHSVKIDDFSSLDQAKNQVPWSSLWNECDDLLQKYLDKDMIDWCILSYLVRNRTESTHFDPNNPT